MLKPAAVRITCAMGGFAGPEGNAMTMLHRIACVMLLVLGAGCSTVPKSTSTRLPMREPYRLLLVYPEQQKKQPLRSLPLHHSLQYRTQF